MQRPVASDARSLVKQKFNNLKESFPLMPKWKVAQVILDRVESFIAAR